MVYLPTFTIKINHSCRYIYQTWILWVVECQEGFVADRSRYAITSASKRLVQLATKGNLSGVPFAGTQVKRKRVGEWSYTEVIPNWCPRSTKEYQRTMGTHVSFIFRAYDPYFEALKPSFFMGFGVQRKELFQKWLSLFEQGPLFCQHVLRTSQCVLR